MLEQQPTRDSEGVESTPPLLREGGALVWPAGSSLQFTVSGDGRQ